MKDILMVVHFRPCTCGWDVGGADVKAVSVPSACIEPFERGVPAEVEDFACDAAGQSPDGLAPAFW